MVDLLGHRDELLRVIEDAFPVHILVRGNEITVSGEPADSEIVARLFEELVVLLEQGHILDREGVGRSIEMLKSDQLPTEVLSTEVVRGARASDPRPRDRSGTSTRLPPTRSRSGSDPPGPARATSRSRSRCSRCRRRK